MGLQKYTKPIAMFLILMQSLWGAEYQGQVMMTVPPPPVAAAAPSAGGTAAPATPAEPPKPVFVPVPGVTVTAVQGDKKLSAVSDPQGVYRFADLPDGTWQLQIEMLGFAPIKQDVTTGNGLPGPTFQLKMLGLDQIEAATAPATPAIAVGPATTVSSTQAAPTPAPAAAAPATAASNAKPAAAGKAGAAGASGKTAFQRTDLNSTSTAAAPANDPPPEITAELNSRAADAGLINGSAMNGAASPYAQSPAFGNARKGGRSLYNGNFSLLGYDNSALNARQFSLTGQDTPKASTSHVNTSVTFGGPIKIPHLIERNGPYFNVSYQRVRNRTDNVSTSLMPDAAERGGNFAQELNALGQPVQIFDPASGTPFANDAIPLSRLSPQALSLLSFYPAANFGGNSRYNFQIPLIQNTHSDSVRAQVQKSFKRKNSITGVFAMSDTRSDNNSQFNFLDLTHSLGMQATGTYTRTYTTRFRGTFSYQFSRQSNQTYPFFSNRVNVAGNAGITGDNQQPLYWGPPSLNFGSGIAGLGDANASIVHNQTGNVSYNSVWSHNRHNITFGGNFLTIQTNVISQSNPRGGFIFTGGSTQQYLANGAPSTQFATGASAVTGTGSDFASFLLGIPDSSTLAFGNADKYFRSHRPYLFVQDDWRFAPGLTLYWGLGWQYSSPVTEKYGRLVNLDIGPGFATAAPVLASSPKGSLSGAGYPNSLLQPDKKGLQPSFAFSWRPFPASSMLVKGGYSLAYNTGVYQQFASSMAQQAPLSTSLRVSNSATSPLTLANGLYAPPNVVTDTFAIDPKFKLGYAQNWNLSVQRDLPGSLVMLVTYTGIKGTHLLQAFLPNTYPTGGVNPCPTCTTGYTYYTSGANSEHEEGRLELRRRLHNGFTATGRYTYAKSIDDTAGLSGLGTAAQNWRNLGAERGLSNNDQRHNASIQLQYTSGMGIGGGGLMSGWRGKLAKDWTFLDNINLGTGLPLTPMCATCLVGSVSGIARASYTGASVYNAPTGLFLNPLAVTAPAAGQWGNAGIGSIRGPNQFSMNASMQRNFKLNDRFNLALTISANNPLNHVVFGSWISTANTQFGARTNPNAMRSIQTTLRLNF